MSIDLVIYLSEFFSKELDDVLIFKWQSIDCLPVSKLKWNSDFDSYIQLYKPVQSMRFVTLLEKQVLSLISARFLNLETPELDLKHLTLIEQFMGWLINKKLMAFMANYHYKLQQSRLVHTTNHMYCFYDLEQVQSIHMQVFSGQEDIGKFKILSSLNVVNQEGVS
eukprot:SAG22_NODE_320_length_12472_cov_2.764002_4_plen_166_part_00